MAEMVGLKWYATDVKRAATDAVHARLRNVAEALRDTIRENVSKPYPPASRPGQYPHRRSGDFMRSIHYRSNRAERSFRVFSANVEYAILLPSGDHARDIN